MELEQLYQMLSNADAMAQRGDQQAAEDARRIAAMIQQKEAAETQQSDRMSGMDRVGDVARSFGSGIVRGLGAMVDAPSQLGQLMGVGLEKLTGVDVGMNRSMPSFIESVGEVAPVVESAAGYDPRTTAGQYAGTIGEFAPGILLPLDELSYLNRFMRASVVPGAASEFAGQSVEALGGGETAQNMARIAAAIGAPMALGATEAGVRRALTQGARAYEPGSERAAAVQTLDELGVGGLTSGARLGSERAIRLEGAEDVSREAIGGINRTVMRLLGSDAQRPTRTALGQVEDRLGGIFDEAGDVAAVPPASSIDDIQKSFDDYMDLQTQEGATVPRTIENIVVEIDNAALAGDQITGRQIQNWRGQLRKLAERSEAGNRGDIADFARGVSSALDDVVLLGAQQSNDPGLYQRLLGARNEYRDLRTVASALNRAGPEARSGIVSPGALASAVRRIEGERAVVTRPSAAPLRPLSQLALAGEEVASSLPTVSSGGRRVSVGQMPTTLGFGSAALATALGLPLDAAATLAVGGLLAPAASKVAVRSPYAQQMLLRDPTLRGALAQQVGLLGQVAPGAIQQNAGPQ